MLSESVYNFAAASRRSTGAGSGSTADQDSDSQQYDSQTTQLQLAASIQQQQQQQQSSQQSQQPQQPQTQSKPRNKRKNFKPISSRMAEVSDESDDREDDGEANNDEANATGNDDGSDMLDYERKTLLQGGEERTGAPTQSGKQRLNNNEVIPMDLSVATRPPSSEGDDDSGDSYRHKFILEQLRSQKMYSPGTDVSLRIIVEIINVFLYNLTTKSSVYTPGEKSSVGIVGQKRRQRRTDGPGPVESAGRAAGRPG